MWPFIQHENERLKTANRQFYKMQICAFLILRTWIAAAEQMDIFLHALIFHMLSELKLLFLLSFC